MRERFEIYISNKNDTIGFQKLVIRNNILDTTRSTFYDLKTEYLKDSTIRGSIELFMEDDYKIESPLLEKEIILNLIQDFGELKDIVEFKSKNTNYINFDFKHQSDTLIGLLTERREYDTIINGEKMIRIIENMFPIDNKILTDNPFIEAFELHKNER